MSCNCKSALAHVAHGAIGIAKSVAGIGLVSSTELIHRRKICGKCPNNKLGICADCGCVIVFKTTQADQKCERWSD